MPVPSEINIRHFPEVTHQKVQVAFAAAWERLVDAHSEQAQQFIGEFANRVTPTLALELYFVVVPVPAEMQEAVWTRALSTLDIDCLPAQSVLPTLAGWRLLRLDLVIKLLQYRRSYHQKTHELARMVGARAAEAITATHVQNAYMLAELLRGQMPVERATAEYLRAFYLPLGTAQTVQQRVAAAVAGEHLAAQYSESAGFELDPESQHSDEYPQPADPMTDPSAPGAPA
jgi:hypothetical protein